MKITISIPTYKANSWCHLDKHGEVEFSAEADDLLEGYANLKAQINELLAQTNAENQVVLELSEIQREIQNRKKFYKI